MDFWLVSALESERPRLTRRERHEAKKEAMKVLVAVDSSTRSEVVAAEVAGRPWPRGTQITVLSVLDVEDLLSSQIYLDNIREKENQAAMSLVQNVASRISSPEVETFTRVIESYPAVGIIDYAKEWGAGLVVVGSHGHTAIGRLLLGSVAKAVVHNALCSVEIVRPKPRGPSGAMKILLPTDGSRYSVTAVRSVAARPWPQGSEMKVVSVVDETLPVADSWYTEGEWLEHQLAEKVKECEEALSVNTQILAATGLRVTSELLKGGVRWRLLDEASHWGANLIVVGSHGRRGIKRLLLGSVSEELALHANCSVEIVRDTACAA
jgi:nucleotide-binding universal stress UspA family protein